VKQRNNTIHRGTASSILSRNFSEVYKRSFKYIISYMEMALYTIPKGYFVLSDRYALLCPKPAINLTPGNTQIENIHAIYCPISSDLCIVFREKKTPDNALHWHNGLQNLTEPQLAQANNLAARSYNQYIYCEDEASLQIIALKKKFPHLPNSFLKTLIKK